jgi:SAM-dependent methyltransferase
MINKDNNPDYFEQYLDYSDAPSIVLVRSVELKNFPKEFIESPILDLGCGDGFFAQCLGLTRLYGCDINKNLVEEARKRNKVYASVDICDSRDLLSLFQESYFQTVISNCTLEHIDGIDRALNNIAVILKRGGYLIFTVPSDNLNDFYFAKLILRKIGLTKCGQRMLEKYNRQQNHINIYSFGVWEKKLKSVGFEVKKHFFLFNKIEYSIITFLDSFGGFYPFKISWFFRKITPRFFRKFLWRLFLKSIYLNSKPLDSGGELIIVAKKI